MKNNENSSNIWEIDIVTRLTEHHFPPVFAEERLISPTSSPTTKAPRDDDVSNNKLPMNSITSGSEYLDAVYSCVDDFYDEGFYESDDEDFDEFISVSTDNYDEYIRECNKPLDTTIFKKRTFASNHKLLDTECPICLLDFDDDVVAVELPCGHKMCRDCLDRQIDMESRNFMSMEKRISAVTSCSDGVYKLHYEKVTGLECMISSCNQVFPFVDFVAKYCSQETAKTVTERHNEHVSYGKKLNEFLFKAMLAGNHNARFCPKCKVPIEKNGGCNHMYCQHCTTAFDWTQAIRIGRTKTHWIDKIKMPTRVH